MEKIELDPRKHMVKFLIVLIVCFLAVTVVTFQEVLFSFQVKRFQLYLIINIILIVTYIVLISAVLFDLISKKEKIVIGKILKNNGLLLTVVTDKRVVKKYRMFNKAVQDMLQPDQEIELTLTQLTNYPISINVRDKKEGIENPIGKCKETTK
ncbi:hypothetical protein ACFP56_10515 [Paenibacillus septentrionalis]|uniref:Alkaline shock response membrane anchor protein AmaP n=1 Tax=Paenibacillus septentrionalis TaxID=429342 RepID=A0ABW1V2N5_9BACL